MGRVCSMWILCEAGLVCVVLSLVGCEAEYPLLEMCDKGVRLSTYVQ